MQQTFTEMIQVLDARDRVRAQFISMFLRLFMVAIGCTAMVSMWRTATPDTIQAASAAFNLLLLIVGVVFLVIVLIGLSFVAGRWKANADNWLDRRPAPAYAPSVIDAAPVRELSPRLLVGASGTGRTVDAVQAFELVHTIADLYRVEGVLTRDATAEHLRARGPVDTNAVTLARQQVMSVYKAATSISTKASVQPRSKAQSAVRETVQTAQTEGFGGLSH